MLSNGQPTGTMRIRIVQTPPVSCIDGVRLDVFLCGQQYEVGNLLGAVMLAEGWAEPVPSDAPGPFVPLDEFAADQVERARDEPPNLKREFFPPYYEGPTAIALERRRRPRRRLS